MLGDLVDDLRQAEAGGGVVGAQLLQCRIAECARHLVAHQTRGVDHHGVRQLVELLHHPPPHAADGDEIEPQQEQGVLQRQAHRDPLLTAVRPRRLDAAEVDHSLSAPSSER